MNKETKLKPLKLKFGEVKLSCPIENGHRMVPVKTVCTAIDVQFKNQDSWLKKHPIYSQLYLLVGVVGVDNKERDMNCLSIFDLYAWLSSIKNDKRREGSIEKQYAFMSLIREKMIQEYKSIEIFQEENKYELELVSLKEDAEVELTKAKDLVVTLKAKVKNIGETIEEIRINRFTGQTALSFPSKN